MADPRDDQPGGPPPGWGLTQTGPHPERPPRRPGEASERAPLPGAAAGWALMGWVVAVFGALVAAGFAQELTGSLAATVAASQAVLWTGLVGTAWWASARYATGNLVEDYQLRIRARDIPVGIGLSVLARLAAVAAGMVVIVALGERIAVPDQLGPLDDDTAALVLALVLSVIGAPVVEELFFRGLLMRALESTIGAAGAVVVQAVLFGVAHVLFAGTWRENLLLIAMLSATGIVLGVAVLRTGRLGPAICAHAAFNLLSVVVLVAPG